jgi:hypothetical protein
MAIDTMEHARKFFFFFTFQGHYKLHCCSSCFLQKNSRICFIKCPMGVPQLLIGFKYKVFFLGVPNDFNVVLLN